MQNNQPIEIFQGNIGKYKIIQSRDGSTTLWSEKFQEACHSLDGAYQETIFNFIAGCQLDHLFIQEKEVNILEVGFGAGLGLRATYDFIQQHNLNNKVHFISLELDSMLVHWAFQNTLKDISDFDNVIEGQLDDLKFISWEDGLFKANILIGNALNTLPQSIKYNFIPKIQAIYQDPFSPQKNSELWTSDWFRLLKKISAPNVKLSTYSAASAVKKAMIDAGWKISSAPGFSRKRESIRATLPKL